MAAAGAGPLGGEGSGVWAVPTSVEAGLEGAGLELLGAGSPESGQSQHRPRTKRELRKGSGILTLEALRLGASTLLESQNFGPFLQVGEHNLHFISKVRRWWGASVSPSFKISPSLPHSLLPTPSPSFTLISSRLCCQIQLFSGPDFLGDHISFEDDQSSLPTSFQPQSCRVHGGR